MLMKRIYTVFLCSVLFLLLCIPAYSQTITDSEISEIATKLKNASGVDLTEVKILRIREPNAYVSPRLLSGGGYSITVTQGLLDVLKTKDELAGVLAHELGHGDGKHWVEKLGAAVGGALLYRVVEGRAMVGNIDLGAVGMVLLQSGLGRTHEVSADDFSVALCMKAGYSPRGLRNALVRLYDWRSRHSVTKQNALFDGFNDHPDIVRRIRHLDMLVEAIEK